MDIDDLISIKFTIYGYPVVIKPILSNLLSDFFALADTAFSHEYFHMLIAIHQVKCLRVSKVMIKGLGLISYLLNQIDLPVIWTNGEDI